MPGQLTRSADMPEQKQFWWFPLWEFAVHVFVGSTIFIIIALPAIGLNLSIHWLERMKVSNIILLGLQGAEYFLFGIDILLFIIFLFKTGWRTILKM